MDKTKPKPILYIGQSISLLNNIQAALESTPEYHLAATSEPAEAIITANYFTFGLFLVDVQTDFEQTLEMLHQMRRSTSPVFPSRLAVTQFDLAKGQMASLVRAGAIGVVFQIDDRPARLIDFLKRYA